MQCKILKLTMNTVELKVALNIFCELVMLIYADMHLKVQ